MSVNLQQIAANVRFRLGSPLPQRPSLQQTFLAVASCAQSLYNRAEQSGQNWATEEIILTVLGNVSDYEISSSSTTIGGNLSAYSKPLQVLTYYPQNLGLPDRYIEFSMLGDMNYDWNLPVNIASTMFTDGSPNTAQRMAFFYQTGASGENALWVRVLPMPQLSAQYRVTFSQGTWADDAAITSSPLLNQFHELIEVWAAQSLLPSTGWSADEKDNRERRKEYAASLKNDQARVEPEFSFYIRNLVQDHLSNRVSSLDDEGLGGWY